MIKNILYILILAVLYSCSPKGKKNSKEKDSLSEKTTTITNFSDSCFSEPDSGFEQIVIGCTNGYYKVISDKFVLKITPNVEIDYNECIELTNDTLVQNFMAELMVFEKGKASLTNICTDKILINAPQPIKILNKCYGKITIGKSDPTNFFGNEMPKMTIRIEQLMFFDNQTGAKIKIENELFWKVLNTGTPG